jgi:hypothetical protein
MLNKLVLSLIIVLFSVLPEGCKAEKPSISKEAHRSTFFPSLNSQTILDYQFLYRFDRGHYVTIAKVTMSTNAYYSLLQKELESVFINESIERDIYFDLLHYRAESLIGGTNNLPTWFNPTKEKAYSYMERKDTSAEQGIWWYDRGNTLYFIAIGKGDVIASHQEKIERYTPAIKENHVHE